MSLPFRSVASRVALGIAAGAFSTAGLLSLGFARTVPKTRPAGDADAYNRAAAAPTATTAIAALPPGQFRSSIVGTAAVPGAASPSVAPAAMTPSPIPSVWNNTPAQLSPESRPVQAPFALRQITLINPGFNSGRYQSFNAPFPEAGASCLWVETLGNMTVAADGRSVFARGDDLERNDAPFRVTAHAPNGDTFRLSWSTPMGLFAGPQRLLVIRVPPGYPPSYRWLDISLTDRSGQAKARWRLTDLPRPRPQPDPNPTPKHYARFDASGILVHARAWTDTAARTTVNPESRWGNAIKAEVIVNAMPQMLAKLPPKQKWEVIVNGPFGEWEPPDLADLQQDRFAATASLSSSSRNVPLTIPQTVQARYPNETQYVLVRGALVLSEEYQEAIRFDAPQYENRRIVSTRQGLMQTTPSGVRVILRPGQSQPEYPSPQRPILIRAEGERPVGVLDTVAIMARYRPEGSPLYRKYGKPVALLCSTRSPYRVVAGGLPEGVKPIAPRIAVAPEPQKGDDEPLTVIVTHRAILKSIPFRLRVAIEKKKIASSAETRRIPKRGDHTSAAAIARVGS